MGFQIIVKHSWIEKIQSNYLHRHEKECWLMVVVHKKKHGVQTMNRLKFAYTLNGQIIMTTSDRDGPQSTLCTLVLKT